MSATAPDTTRATAGTVSAHAKINLTLDILGRREDGFHEVRSLVIGVDLCDRIGCRSAQLPGVTITCADPTISGAKNLCYHAAVKVAERLGIRPTVEIEIDKLIPIGAGLGGGSSDAAAALRLCNKVWGSRLSDRELAEIGAALGSDVPLFFSLPAAVLTGRGERVQRLRLQWCGWVLLVFPSEAIATADVYGAWRPSDAAGLPTGMDGEIVKAATAAEISPWLSNHLTPALFRVSPKTEQIYAELNRRGLGPMHVTGTGSTLFRLFDEREAACRTAGEMEKLQLGVSTAVVAAPAGPSSTTSEE